MFGSTGKMEVLRPVSTTGTPKVCKMMALMAVIMGLGLLLHILFGGFLLLRGVLLDGSLVLWPLVALLVASEYPLSGTFVNIGAGTCGPPDPVPWSAAWDP